MESVRIFKNSS